MKSDECLAWTRRHHEVGAGKAAAEIETILGLLSRSAPGKKMATNHFQACLNSRDLFRVVKLVHVAENAEPGDEQSGWDLVPGRRRAVISVLEGLNRRWATRFDVESLGRVYDAVLDSGAGGWYPILGFEHHPDQGRFPEISLYAEHRAMAAASAAAGAVFEGEDLKKALQWARGVFALGLDLLAEGGLRVKFYLDSPPAKAARLLEDLDARLTPPRSLTLVRSRPEGGFETTRKSYVPLPARRDAAVTALSGDDFPNVTRGRLRGFARYVARAVYGQHLFYIGASREKVEIYFGKGEARA